MMMIKKFGAALVMTILATGCGTQFGGNYSGSVQMTSGSTLQNTTFKMTLYQTSSTVTGQWEATGATGVTPISGELTGTVNGSTLQSVQMIVPTGATYAGTYSGNLTLAGTQLTGTVTGSVTGAAGGSLTIVPSATQSR
jgi:hypothetical protein